MIHERFASGESDVPLRVHVLFHPESEVAAEVAERVYLLLHGPSTELHGMRIPVRFGLTTDDGAPRDLTLDGERNLVIVLVDRRMARSGTSAEGRIAAAWAGLLEELVRRYPPGGGVQCSVLPVAVDREAFGLSRELSLRNFVSYRARGPRHLEFHVVLGCLRLVRHQPASLRGDVEALPPSTVSMFISHAKVNLGEDDTRGPVGALNAARHHLPLQEWFDSQDIPVGAEFAAKLDEAIDAAQVVIVVLTDGWSSREWCRWEVLTAKRKRRPLVVIDAVKSQVVRLFPYIGNAPTVRWRAALMRATDENAPSLPELRERDALEAEDAATVLLVALAEALRHQHEVVRLKGVVGDGQFVVGTPPELVTVAGVGTEQANQLYPDPPLGRDEVGRLKSARDGLELVTPLEQLTQQQPNSQSGAPIALSLSGAPDAARYGGSDLHLATMAHDLALYLLLSRYRLVYGGVLGHSALGGGHVAPGDEVNYVERLMELVDRYQPMAERLDVNLAPIENWLAFPLEHELTEGQKNLYVGGRAKRVPVDPPAGLPLDSFLPGKTGRYPRKKAEARYVRARSLTEMRERMTSYAFARIAVGGRLTHYSGLLPGVVEEALISLRAHKPLFLLGAFGGAARVVLDLLGGHLRAELTSDWVARHSSDRSALSAQYQHFGRPAPAPEETSTEIIELGRGGLAAALNNGLSEEENHQLAHTTDGPRGVALVLKGLRELGA